MNHPHIPGLLGIDAGRGQHQATGLTLADGSDHERRDDGR
jgi:hypothetical protein